MERSEEAEQAVREFASVFSTGDADGVDGLFSTQAVRVIGTDPAEWWGPDRDDVVRRLRAQVEVLGGQVKVEVNDPESGRVGDMAWVADQPTLRLPDGTDVPTRFTAVLREEDGKWRFVQVHFSMGVANEEVIGEELPI